MASSNTLIGVGVGGNDYPAKISRLKTARLAIPCGTGPEFAGQANTETPAQAPACLLAHPTTLTMPHVPSKMDNHRCCDPTATRCRMSHSAIFSAILVIASAILSLGCCCPARFGPVMVPAPPIVVQAPQDNQAALDQKKAADDLAQLVAQNLGPNNRIGGLAPNSLLWGKIRQSTMQHSYKTNPAIGGAFANTPFNETQASGGVLIGFFAGEDNGGHVGFLQPIFLTAQGEKAGTAYGAIRRPVQCLKAKAGYALGGVDLRGGGVIDAITLVFMKVNGERLNPADRYTSATLGGNGGGPSSFASNGGLLIGIHGKTTENEGFVPAGAIASLGFLSLP
jgi:hypothetical protein